MSKRTPGPWAVQLVSGSYRRAALVMAGNKLVASCMGDQLDPTGTSIGEAAANAHLIAAAPDLLDALIRMHAAFNAKTPIPTDEGNALEAMCVTAIRKAEGSS